MTNEKPRTGSATFTVKAELNSWYCLHCEAEFVVMLVLHHTDEDTGKREAFVSAIANVDRPPHCPLCGTRWTPNAALTGGEAVPSNGVVGTPNQKGGAT